MRKENKTMTQKETLVEDRSHPLVTGLIYEDSPASIRDGRGALVVDYRLLNLELALQEADRRIAEVEGKILEIEKKRGGKR